VSIEEYARVARQGTEEVVRMHAPLVKKIACHLIARLPSQVEIDDLIQAGMIGLLDASRKFSAAKGASFATYASIRIRGAMIDELRRNDWLPRSVHRRTREITDAIRRVEMRDGREARGEQVAAELGMSTDQYGALLAEVNASRMFSLEDLRGEGGELAEEADDGATPAAEFERERLQQAVAEEIARLPEREKLVLSLYYEQELNLREVGEVLEVTESRVCQIHGQALLRLRARLGSWFDTTDGTGPG